MFDSLCLEEIARSMKWGFLSDNIVNIIDKYRSGSNKLNENEKKIVNGAIEFFEMVEYGIESIGKSYFPGGIEKIVESLLVFDYTWKILMPEGSRCKAFLKDIVKKKVEELLGICRKLYNDEKQNEKEIGTLCKFFLFLGRLTFQETANLLDN